MKAFEIICCIVDKEKGTKVLKIAKSLGIKGGTIFLGKGSAKHWLLNLLDINEVRKEIVWMIHEKNPEFDVAEAISNQLLMQKKGHGIAFTMPIDLLNYPTERSDISMYHAIYTVVEKGKAEEVVDAAVQAGAKGATIWNGRGSGIHETEIVFAMPIEPEKEIVLIVTEADFTAKISEQIKTQLNIDKPGNGILFIMPVNEIYGLAKSKN